MQNVLLENSANENKDYVSGSDNFYIQMNRIYIVN